VLYVKWFTYASLGCLQQVKFLIYRKCDNEAILQNIGNKNQNTGVMYPSMLILCNSFLYNIYFNTKERTRYTL
jgi:hypothetical protein